MPMTNISFKDRSRQFKRDDLLSRKIFYFGSKCPLRRIVGFPLVFALYKVNSTTDFNSGFHGWITDFSYWITDSLSAETGFRSEILNVSGTGLRILCQWILDSNPKY